MYNYYQGELEHRGTVLLYGPAQVVIVNPHQGQTLKETNANYDKNELLSRPSREESEEFERLWDVSCNALIIPVLSNYWWDTKLGWRKMDSLVPFQEPPYDRKGLDHYRHDGIRCWWWERNSQGWVVVPGPTDSYINDGKSPYYDANGIGWKYDYPGGIWMMFPRKALTLSYS